jgi:uncharacterized membrane protein
VRSEALGSGESRLESIVSYILLGGVVISLILEATGIFFYHRTYGSFNLLTQNQELFMHGRNFFTFLFGIVEQGRAESPGLFLMTLGAAVLILTPYCMVLTVFAYFLLKRRYKYLLITSVIVAIITLSLALH